MQFNYTSAGRFFIAGSQQRIQAALDDPELRIYLRNDSAVKVEKVTLTTDDWPNFYQRRPGIPLNVVITSSILLLFWLVLLPRTGTRLSSLRWHFFFLGAGFMLLETQIVSRMALLFGTTWLVNAVVVGGLLLLIVGANLLIEWMPQFPYSVAYTGVFLSLAVGYLVPMDRLFLPSIWLKAGLAVLVLCLPVFFVGLVFTRGAHNFYMAQNLIDYGRVGYIHVYCGRIGGRGHFSKNKRFGEFAKAGVRDRRLAKNKPGCSPSSRGPAP